MAQISINHLFKRFGQDEVIKDINLEFEEGEFIVRQIDIASNDCRIGNY